MEKYDEYLIIDKRTNDVVASACNVHIAYDIATLLIKDFCGFTLDPRDANNHVYTVKPKVFNELGI